MEQRTSRTPSWSGSWQDSDPTHLPSHQARTPTTLISSKLPHLNPSPPALTPSQSPRRNNINLYRLPTHILLLILLTCIVPITKAATIYIPEQMVETPKNLAPAVPDHPEDVRSGISRLAQSGPLLVDLSPPPRPQAHDWVLATVAADLKKRQVGGDEPVKSKQSTSTQASSTIQQISSMTSTSTSPSSTESIAAAEETGSTPLPQIFDTGFGSNLTDSCEVFMNNMLNNETFKSCLPFSLLIQNSNSFFQTLRSVLLTTRLLDHTCAANTTLCTSVLSSFATNLTRSTSCASDLTNGNPLIKQAHLGLLAYKPLFTASCLRNAKTSAYCFADAATNKSSPTDAYIYQLPINNTLPPIFAPTCSGCLQDTMAVFSASDDGKGGGNAALADTYFNAAQTVNSLCGANFVNTSLAVPVIPASGASSSPHVGAMGLVTLVVVMASWLL